MIYSTVTLRYVIATLLYFVCVELYENLGRVGTTLKENFLGGVRNMWESISEFARSHTTGQAGGSSEQQAGSVAVEPKAEPEGQFGVLYCSCNVLCI